MRNAHRVADVRTAETELMARVTDGALMQRAAAGLASVCARLLGQVYGARVVVLAGTGDNGGDALYAGALLAGRGAVVTAITTGARAHAGGVSALLRSGGQLVAADVAGRDGKRRAGQCGGRAARRAWTARRPGPAART